MDAYGYKAFVINHFRPYPDGAVGLYLAERRVMDGAVKDFVAEPATLAWREHPEAAAIEEPSLLLPDPLARALLDALSQYYGGTADMRALRKDYDAERSRVDKFIAYFTGGARRE